MIYSIDRYCIVNIIIIILLLMFQMFAIIF